MENREGHWAGLLYDFPTYATFLADDAAETHIDVMTVVKEMKPPPQLTDLYNCSTDS